MFRIGVGLAGEIGSDDRVSTAMEVRRVGSANLRRHRRRRAEDSGVSLDEATDDPLQLVGRNGGLLERRAEKSRSLFHRAEDFFDLVRLRFGGGEGELRGIVEHDRP